MIRVSYSTNDNGDLVSNLFPLQSDMAFILITVKERRYQLRGIADDGTVRLLSEGSGRTIPVCQHKARQCLVRLGVVFKDDLRRKK